MSEQKKYLDLDGLEHYDEKIKQWAKDLLESIINDTNGDTNE